MDNLVAVKNEFKSQVIDNILSKLTIKIVLQYLLEGLAIAIAAYVIPNKRTKFNEIAGITLFASLALFLLDLFSNDIAVGARFGAGFGIGYNLATALKSILPLI